MGFAREVAIDYWNDIIEVAPFGVSLHAWSIDNRDYLYGGRSLYHLIVELLVQDQS